MVPAGAQGHQPGGHEQDERRPQPADAEAQQVDGQTGRYERRRRADHGPGEVAEVPGADEHAVEHEHDGVQGL